MIRASVLGLVIAVTLHSHAYAQNTLPSVNEEFFVTGFGNHDCGVWIEARAGRGEFHWGGMLEWARGLVTGFNRYAGGTGNAGEDITPQAIAGWLDKYCREQPLNSFIWAGETLALELEGRQLAKQNQE